MNKIGFILLSLFGAVAVVDAQDYQGYEGKGGMLAHKIEPFVFEYHYDHGFTGEDVMGWDPELNFAWSRLAAAEACSGMDISKEALIELLVDRYGHSTVVHEVNGIEFNYAQIMANPDFCTPSRTEEAIRWVSDFAEGGLPVEDLLDEQTPVSSIKESSIPEGVVSETDSLPEHAIVSESEGFSSASVFTVNYQIGKGEGGRDQGDFQLRFVGREHTGRAIGIQALTGALLGGAGGIGFGKSQLHGRRIESLPNPGVSLLRDAIERKIDDYFSAHPDRLPDEPVTVNVQGHDWVLIYEKLSDEDSPYELRYTTTISVTSRSRGFLRQGRYSFSMNCSPERRTASLEDWERDDYSMVKRVADDYVAECVERFATVLPVHFY